MNTLLPALAGIAPCLLAVWYAEFRTRTLRRRCSQLQTELASHCEVEKRLDFIAHHDSLTGLPNRLQLQLRLEHGIAWARRHDSRLAVLFVDIDRFKEINDTLGHDAGDQVLVQFAQRLRQCVREVDTVARQGGDEFIVLLGELRTAADAQHVADKILGTIAAPFMIHGQALDVAASVGVAVYPDDGGDLVGLLEKADLAMYAAKQRRRGASARFAPGMQVKAYSRLILEAALRHALEHREFVLAYQPRLDLHQQRITGVKALLRWQHPELGLVMPLDFLPVLEESALILPVGDWVLATAVDQARRWLARGTPLRVSVHLSPRQLYQKDIARTLQGLLAQAGVPGRYIEIDIAESTLIDRGQHGEELLRQIKELGVRIVISAFGTGYASLNYLRRFPVDVVKIDQRLVDGLRGAPAGEGAGAACAMMRSIIAMAHALNMEVVAGGVEDADQMARLTALGCDEAFGFCFSAAVAPTEVDAMLAAHFSCGEALTL
jgi:diguanylate cyclase (GGDEF)-like protein